MLSPLLVREPGTYGRDENLSLGYWSLCPLLHLVLGQSLVHPWSAAVRSAPLAPGVLPLWLLPESRQQRSFRPLQKTSDLFPGIWPQGKVPSPRVQGRPGECSRSRWKLAGSPYRLGNGCFWLTSALGSWRPPKCGIRLDLRCGLASDSLLTPISQDLLGLLAFVFGLG